MKNLIIVLLLLIALSSEAQRKPVIRHHETVSKEFTNNKPFTDLYYGYNSQGAAIATWAVGYNTQYANVQAEMRPSLTRKVEMNNLFGVRLSANISNTEVNGLYISPGLAYLYNLRSNDKKELNAWYFAPALKTGLMMNERAGLGFDFMYVRKSLQASFGIHYLFN